MLRGLGDFMVVYLRRREARIVDLPTVILPRSSTDCGGG